jgi:hypothetical protein
VRVENRLRLEAIGAVPGAGIPRWMARRDAKGRAERVLLHAVVAIWQHTEQHTTYVEGVGYTSRSDQQVCADPEEHARLSCAEGEAWHEYRAIDEAQRSLA